MSDLDLKEQNHVRTALRYLHRRMGTWSAVADALRTTNGTLKMVLSERNPVTASMAIRVARLAGVMVDDLLVGRIFPPGSCPNCGHVLGSDFAAEHTVTEAAPRSPAGLTVVP